jgi:hypothetical protein
MYRPIVAIVQCKMYTKCTAAYHRRVKHVARRSRHPPTTLVGFEPIASRYERV